MEKSRVGYVSLLLAVYLHHDLSSSCIVLCILLSLYTTFTIEPFLFLLPIRRLNGGGNPKMIAEIEFVGALYDCFIAHELKGGYLKARLWRTITMRGVAVEIDAIETRLEGKGVGSVVFVDKGIPGEFVGNGRMMSGFGFTF